MDKPRLCNKKCFHKLSAVLYTLHPVEKNDLKNYNGSLYMKRRNTSFVASIALGGIFFIVVSLLAAVVFFQFKTEEHNRTFIKQKVIAITPTPTPTPLTSVKLPILMYHYVEHVKDSRDFIRKRLDINPELFENQVKTLQDAGYVSYFVRDVPLILAGRMKVAERPIIFTFDDGYEDFYTTAYPILKKYGVKSTIYIINDYVGRKGFLNDAEIQELAKSDIVEIGAHTLNHIYLKYASPQVAQKEIEDSKTKLEEKYHITVYTFAYPFGAVNDIIVSLTKKAGYTAAVGVNPGQTQSLGNLYMLTRIRPGALVGPNMIKIIQNFRN